MIPDADKLWAKSVRALQSLKGQQPTTKEGIEALLAQAEEFPASDEEIVALVKRVAAGKSLPLEYDADMSWLEGEEVEQLESDLRVLNRNAGEADADTNGLLSDLRAQLLDDECSDEHTNGNGSTT